MIRYYIEQPANTDWKIKFEPPTKANGNAGVDLYCANSVERVVPHMGRLVVHTGVYLAMPNGVEAQVRGRSGLTRDHGVSPMLGTVDPSYRGEVMVTLFNFGNAPYEIVPGERVAQLVFGIYLPLGIGLDKYAVEFEQVTQREMLGETKRGTSGHGSSGRT